MTNFRIFRNERLCWQQFDENGRKSCKEEKILWEKEKSFVTSNFSFSQSVFKKLVLGQVKAMVCSGMADNWLICWCFIMLSRLFSPFPNDKFYSSKLQRVCWWQFLIWWMWQNVLQTGKTPCWKRRNCSLRVISPFPTVFSKHLFCRHVKTRACLGKS